MCGRISLRQNTVDLPQLRSLQLELCYNVPPTTMVPILRVRHHEKEYAAAKWGLIPFWAKDQKIGYKTINARAETVGEKPAFKEGFKRRRCFLVADGYYEWKREGKAKQPFHIRRADDQPFYFFGLWESWRGPREERLEESLHTCTIITTAANELTSPIHDRMPVLCDMEATCIEPWLDPEFEDFSYLESLLGPYDGNDLVTVPVNAYVNNVANDGPECIEAVSGDGSSAEQLTLQ
jgi:putative SOS response-associated peptidase YedK